MSKLAVDAMREALEKIARIAPPCLVTGQVGSDALVLLGSAKCNRPYSRCIGCIARKTLIEVLKLEVSSEMKGEKQ